jgi:hypothetical protein
MNSGIKIKLKKNLPDIGRFFFPHFLEAWDCGRKEGIDTSYLHVLLLIFQVSHNKFPNLFFAAFSQTCIRLDLADHGLQVLDFVDPVVVHGMPVRFQSSGLIPVSECKRGYSKDF